MADAATYPAIAGYTVGTWKIDPTHSEVSFRIKHTLIEMRGRFVDLTGKIETKDDLLQSSVEVVIDPASFWTGSTLRDEKIRYLADFLEARTWPAITFRSTRLEPAGDQRHFRLAGALTCRGVSRDITLDATFNGFGRSALYGLRMGFSANVQLDRRDFGIVTVPPSIEASLPLKEGNSMLGCLLDVEIQVEAVLETEEGKYKWS